MQSVGMTGFIYIPAAWAFGAMLFGATLWNRKLLSDFAFGGGFTTFVLGVLASTVLTQEIHIPVVSTQKIWLPCPAPPEGSWSAWFEEVLNFSELAQSVLRRL